MSISGRSSFSCIHTTLPPPSLRSLASRDSRAGFSASAFCTRYLTIFFSNLMRLMVPSRRSEAAVVAFLQRVEQVGGGMHLAVVLDLLVPAHLDLGAVLHREHVGRVLEVVLLDQHALERLGIEAEGRAALEAALVPEEVDVLEVLVAEVGRHVRRIRDRGVHPLLARRLDLDVLPRAA